MKVNVKDIRAGKVSRDWLESGDSVNEILEKEPHNTIRVSKSFSVHMELTSVGNDIEVFGNFDADVSFSCDRCLADSGLNLKENFHYILIPKKTSETDVIEEEEEETELLYFDSDEIDLTEIAIEQLMLSMPYKLLCKDDCKGICQGCGANLNTESCKCSKNNKDTVLAKKLRTLKNKE